MIQHWKRRILTRVAVVNSLIIPKINPLFIALPTPRRETILDIQDILELIWNAKCDLVGVNLFLPCIDNSIMG